MLPHRITHTLAIALLLVAGWVAPANASQLREPLEVRLAVTSDIGPGAHETGQGKWIQFREATGSGVGIATIGAREYLVTADVAVRGKINATLTDSQKTAVGTVTFVPTAAGDVLDCEFTRQYRNVEADEIGGFAEVGFIHQRCDNGTKMTADLYGAYELDPASGMLVFYMNYTGEAKT